MLKVFLIKVQMWEMFVSTSTFYYQHTNLFQQYKLKENEHTEKAVNYDCKNIYSWGPRMNETDTSQAN